MSISVVIFLVSVILFPCSGKEPHVTPQYEFDFLLLAQNWGVGYCEGENYLNKSAHCGSSSNPMNQWTIHGLWPNNNDTSYPANCDNNWHLNVNVLEDILHLLESDWPSYDGTDNSFWSHEWEKHGTCAALGLPETLGSPPLYFQKTLSLSSQLNISGLLEVHQILPSNTSTIPSRWIRDALYRAVGADPILNCVSIPWANTGLAQSGDMSLKHTTMVQVLVEIEFCVDKHNFKVFECSDDMYATATCNLDQNLFYPAPPK